MTNETIQGPRSRMPRWALASNNFFAYSSSHVFQLAQQFFVVESHRAVKAISQA